MSIRLLNVNYNRTNVRIYQFKPRAVHAVLTFMWHTTPSIVKQMIKKMFFTPVKRKMTPEEKSCLARGTAFKTSINNQGVQCWKWGRGPGILLVHGWNGRGIHFHRYIEPLVQAGYSVITFDGPGHGKSQGKTSSYFELTDAVRSFLNHDNRFNIQGVIAHSLGASAVINGIVKEKCPMDVVLIAPALRLREILYDAFDGYGVPQQIYHHVIGEFEDQFGYDFNRDNPYHLLKRINSRIKIVHDKNDRTIPYSDSREAAHTFQNVSLHTTEGLGHKRIMTDPSVVDYIINDMAHSNITEDKEMMNIGTILAEYRVADHEKRLHLFLECPSLRTQFIEIDQNEFRPHISDGNAS